MHLEKNLTARIDNVTDHKRKELLGIRDTLRSLSEDTANHVCMTDSKVRALDFDKIKTNYTQLFNISEEDTNSVDAVIPFINTQSAKTQYCFVEFKNGTFINKDIRDKARDSILIFCDLERMKTNEARSNSLFILVYNPEKAAIDQREKIHYHQIKKRAGRPYAHFNLKPLYLHFHDVEVCTSEEFNNMVSGLNCI